MAPADPVFKAERSFFYSIPGDDRNGYDGSHGEEEELYGS